MFAVGRVARPPQVLKAGRIVGELAPWLRVRDGDYRLYLRPLTDTELATLDVELPESGYLVNRIIDKKDETRTLRALR
jgi:hypothetical protein